MEKPCIRRLILRNFKGIEKGDLELFPLTMLIGANNSGKTTVLEALFLAPNPFRSTPYARRAVEVLRAIHETLDSAGYAFLLHDYIARSAKIVCGLKNAAYLLELGITDNYIHILARKDPRSASRPESLLGILSSDYESLGRLGLYRDKVEPRSLELHMDETLLIRPDLIKCAYKYLRDRWIEVVNRRIGRRVSKALSEILAERLLDLTIEPFGEGLSALYAYTRGGKRIRLGDMGDGVQTLAVAMALVELVEPKVLLWDDVEAHMNPRMLAYVSEWLCDLVEKGMQVVVSTHSLEAVRALTGIAGERSRVLLLDIEEGELRVKELSGEEVEELSRAGIDARASGRLLL